MTEANLLPPIDVIMANFRYEEKSGILIWRYRPISSFSSTRDAEAWNCRLCNMPAGSMVRGYLRVLISGYGRFLAHRIIFKMATGYEPMAIDHIDGNTLNNKIENLRAVDALLNAQNTCISTRNSSGVIGVRWEAKNKKWRAMITTNKKFKHLGYFDDFDQAKEARKAAEKHFGFHKNHGRDRINPLSPQTA